MKILETIDVGDPVRSFQFGKLPPAAGVPVLWKILPLMPTIIKGVSLLQSAAAAASTTATPDNATAIAAAFSDDNLENLLMGLTSKLSGKEVFEMMETVFASVMLNGQPIDAKFTFGDGVSRDAFIVFGNALRVNFAGFLGGGTAGSTSSAAIVTK
jgi:hypothetical protein